MKTTSKIVLAVVGLVSVTSIAFGAEDIIIGPSKSVPEVLSPLWLAVPLVGMMAFNFIRRKKE